MKIKIIATIAGAFLFGISNISGQGTHDHKMAAGHQTEVKKYSAPEAFQKQLGEVLTEYLVLKDALVASDEAKAEKAAGETLKALGAVDMMLLEGDAHMAWMKQQKAIESNLKGIAQMKGLEMKRSHFSTVSGNLTDAINSFGVVTNHTVYVEHCTMANNGQGANWLSTEKEIKNPYYGDAMLKCGTVKATVN